jgi:hypothetical protein
MDHGVDIESLAVERELADGGLMESPPAIDKRMQELISV